MPRRSQRNPAHLKRSYSYLLLRVLAHSIELSWLISVAHLPATRLFDLPRFPAILMKDMEENFDTAEPVELSIDGTLDLHTFNPREVKKLLPHYLDTCRGKGIYEVRIIHGKGTGMLRETVHSILRQLPGILSFRLAGENAGGWGATIVQLEPVSSQHATVEENS